jgi:hypothetical protein
MSFKLYFRWQLPSWIPKAFVLSAQPLPTTISFRWKDPESFFLRLRESNVTKAVYVISHETDSFELQDLLPLLMRQPWAKLTNTLYLHNKIVYYFDIDTSFVPDR